VGELKNFKFDGQVDHIKSQPTDDKQSLNKLSLKWACLWSRGQFILQGFQS